MATSRPTAPLSEGQRDWLWTIRGAGPGGIAVYKLLDLHGRAKTWSGLYMRSLVTAIKDHNDYHTVDAVCRTGCPLGADPIAMVTVRSASGYVDRHWNRLADEATALSAEEVVALDPHDDDALWQAVCSPHATTDQLHAAIKRGGGWALRAANHPSLDLESCQQLAAGDNEELACAVVSARGTQPEVVRAGGTSRWCSVRRLVAQSTQDHDVLTHLALDTDQDVARTAIGRIDHLDPETTRAICRRRNTAVLVALAARADIDMQTASELARKKSEDVLCTLRENPAVPGHIRVGIALVKPGL